MKTGSIWQWWKEFLAIFHPPWSSIQSKQVFTVLLESKQLCMFLIHSIVSSIRSKTFYSTCMTLTSSSCVFRKTKYFYKGRLDWDDRSSAGRYVRDNCKPLTVIFYVLMEKSLGELLVTQNLDHNNCVTFWWHLHLVLEEYCTEM